VRVQAVPDPLLQIRELSVQAAGGPVLLDRLTFDLAAGERLALLGGSGAGKSVLAQCLLGLLQPPLCWRSGSIRWQGQEMSLLSSKQWHALRGNGIFLIFQSPGALLDPLLSVGYQLEQVAQRAQRPAATVEQALALVQLPAPVLRHHAHQLSGGMKQRVLCAMALLLRPQLVIADEPTSSLDDETAQEVLCALLAMQQATGCALLLITHDLRLVRQHAQRVLVLERGRIVEQAPAERFLTAPASRAGTALVQAARWLDGQSL